MVVTLAQPAQSSVQFVHDIVAARSGGVNAAFFNSIEAEWRQRVENYIAHQGSPAAVPKWAALTKPQEGSLLNLYLSPAEGSINANLLSALRNHGLNLCPACGEPGRPNTLDHYLPKGDYPHFCITPLNLFPMCDACQSKKLSKTNDALSPRFFIHPYFDTFVAQQVLQLSIQQPYSAPRFLLGPSPHLTPDERSLLTTHVRELQIETRYIEAVREMHIGLVRAAAALRAAGQPVGPQIDAFRVIKGARSANAWEYVFYTAARLDAGYLDYLENGQLPANP